MSKIKVGTKIRTSRDTVGVYLGDVHDDKNGIDVCVVKYQGSSYKAFKKSHLGYLIAMMKDEYQGPFAAGKEK